MKDLIFDFETVGQDVTKIPVADCSYYIFDWDRFGSSNPYTFKELISVIRKDKLDVREQVEKYGCSYTNADLEFWKSLGPAALASIAPKKTDISLVQFVDNFIAYAASEKFKHWWSRSNTFDPIIMARLTRLVDRENEFYNLAKYWYVRDTRTYIDAKFDFKQYPNGFVPLADEKYWNSVFVQHNSTHDVAADILRLQTIHRAENDLEVTAR